MSTHMPGFQSFLDVLHHFVLAKLGTSSIRVKTYSCLKQPELPNCFGDISLTKTIVGKYLKEIELFIKTLSTTLLH